MYPRGTNSYTMAAAATERCVREPLSVDIGLPAVEGHHRRYDGDEDEVHYIRSPTYRSSQVHDGQRSAERQYNYEHPRLHQPYDQLHHQHLYAQHRQNYLSRRPLDDVDPSIPAIEIDDYRLDFRRDDRELSVEHRRQNVQWSKHSNYHVEALADRRYPGDVEVMVSSPPLTPDVQHGYPTKPVTDSAEKLDDANGIAAQQVPKSKVEEELCTICGDRASGYHYNALSCEGCKGFFRRSITRGAHYVCKYGDNCEMDMWMRRKCQACRLKQCRTVGMKEECLLSERQCVARNARRNTRAKPRIPRHRLGTTSARNQVMSAALSSSVGPLTPGPVDRQSPQCRSPLDQLSEDHREMVTRIIRYQDKYELPAPEDIERISALNIASTFAQVSPSDAVFGHMIEMTILVTRLVVEFAKHLPGFQSLCKEDQIVLLKGSASEVMMLRTSRRFDPETNTVVFGDGQPFTRDCMSFGGLQGFVDSMFYFSRGMATLTVDNAEYALLTALCIFSERPGLREPRAITSIQEVYSNILISYVSHRRLYGCHHLAKLLMKLVELRTLSEEHSQCLYRLTVERGSLPPLLNEYFDIPPSAASTKS